MFKTYSQNNQICKTPSAATPQLPILLLLISFPAVGAMIFTPALPMIANDFMLSVQTVQLVVSLYLLGIAIGQLLYGPLSNRFGRKPALCVGIFLAILGTTITIIAAWLHWYGLVTFGRLLTALGTCVGMMMNFTLISDSYTHEQSRRIMSYTLMLSAIMPGIAAAIGGFLVQTFNWHATLYFLFAYCVGLFLICQRLPETNSACNPDALNLSSIVCGYWQQFSNLKLVLGAVLMGCNTAIIYTFSAISPFLVIQYMQLTPEQYGQLMLIPSVGLLLGSLLSANLVEVLKTKQVITLGLCFMMLGVVLMLTTFKFFCPNPWNMFASMFLIYIGITLCYSNVSALSMTATRDASNGSATVGFINATISMLSVFIIQIFQISDIMFMPLILLFILSSMIIFYLILINI